MKCGRLRAQINLGQECPDMADAPTTRMVRKVCSQGRSRAERDQEIHLRCQRFILEEEEKVRYRLTSLVWQLSITWLSFELWYAVPQPDVVPAKIVQLF